MTVGGAGWLLLLGSNLASDARVQAAACRLRAAAPLDLLTPVRRFSDYAAATPAADYFNALAFWHLDAPRAPASARLKAIEQALGRKRGGGEVAIDIDILALRDADGNWAVDAHALAKGAFVQPPTRALLAEAGIELPT